MENNLKDEELRKIRDEVISCNKCNLRKTRKFPVIGEGNHQARIMFVGEAPGARENETGHPFCGAAGKILDDLLNSVGIKRSDVYIANILKCRPPENRDPLKEEITACSPYLVRQIEIIKPKVVCALGRFAMNFLMGKFGLKNEIQPISIAHGKVYTAKVDTGENISEDFEEVKIIAFYHPAVVAYNANMKKELEKDFEVLEKFR